MSRVMSRIHDGLKEWPHMKVCSLNRAPGPDVEGSLDHVATRSADLGAGLPVFLFSPVTQVAGALPQSPHPR